VIRRFVIFGATGDLTARYLLPAMALLHELGRLPDNLAITGVAHDAWDTQRFRGHVEEQLARHAAHVSARSRNEIVSQLEYCTADIAEREQVAAALGAAAEPIVAYLALPPRFFGPAVKALVAAQVPRARRRQLRPAEQWSYQAR
jgi:glucose-6-phosphate 1-dehydrogenase